MHDSCFWAIGCERESAILEMHSVGPRLRKLVGRQECFCVFWSACKILVFAEGFGLKKVTSGSYVNVSIIKQIFDYIFKFCHCRGYYRCLEVYRNCRWRLVLDFLVFFVQYLLWQLFCLCPLFWAWSLCSRYVYVLRASLCCAERLSFSLEKVMEAISNFVRSKYLSSANAGCGRRCQFDLTWNGWGLPAESANIYCKRI